jgi:hypothetical protein
VHLLFIINCGWIDWRLKCQVKDFGYYFMLFEGPEFGTVSLNQALEYTHSALPINLLDTVSVIFLYPSLLCVMLHVCYYCGPY